MGAELQDRVVVVTGGGGGIGLGLIRHFASIGAKVVIAEIDQRRLDGAVEDVAKLGAECLGIRTDVLERHSIQAMVDATVARFGRVDGLVNNALVPTSVVGVPTAQVALDELTEEHLDLDFRGHVKATLWGMQAVYPHMKKAGWGRIVNVGSSAGLIGTKGFGSYGAAKEAVRSLTRTAAREWAVDGIVVNCYCPSSISHHQGKWQMDPYAAQSVEILRALLPAGDPDSIGDPELDIAPVVAFLLSDECHYLTGQTLTLSGGAFAFA